MNNFFRSLTVICGLVFISAPVFSETRLTVFAAASLKDVLDEVVQDYPGDVVISYGGSGLLARQIAEGAPADLAILANSVWMDWLEDQEGLRLLDRQDFLGNRLVLVGPAGAPDLPGVTGQDLSERLGTGRLAIGMTQSVPAGIYGRQWLENIGLWDVLEPRLAQTDNVRAALALVTRGETPLGIVYASDARAEDGVAILYEIPADTHDPIVYPMALFDGKNVEQASELKDFILSDEAGQIFRDHGFDTLRGSP